MEEIERIKKLVAELLNDSKSGHDVNHIERVYHLAMSFAEKENADKRIVGLAALLHDVDDYKFFGNENAKNLTNARLFLNEAKIDGDSQEKVLKIIRTMGYNRSLQGIRPKTIEGQIVSDADMCDAIGANGILRSYAYALSHNQTFFDKTVWPLETMDAETYMQRTSTSAICHFFEKTLKLKDMMMTESGRQEAINRNKITIEFLQHLFAEENAPEWTEYLKKFLQNNQ